MRAIAIAAAMMLAACAASAQTRDTFRAEIGPTYVEACARGLMSAYPVLQHERANRFCQCGFNVYADAATEREAAAIIAEVRGTMTREDRDIGNAFAARMEDTLDARCVTPIIREGR